MSDALLLLLRVNLALAAAVAGVMALRLAVRRLCGAGTAYALWSLAPLAMLAMIVPGRVVAVIRAPAQAGAGRVWSEGPAAAPVQAAFDGRPLLAAAWLAGAALSFAWLAWRQLRFARAARAGRAGPAVIGVLRPRIVTPDDFAQRYTAREQVVVLAHEATHVARHDSRINAVVALVRCASWFNPFAHLMAHYLRIDQELACDAAVVAAHPTARRSYAEALLKTQLAARPLPLGCYWPAQAAHPLAERIALLSRRTPGRAARRIGPAAVALLTLGGACAAWAARPADIVVAPAAETWARPARATAVAAEAPAPRPAVAPRPASLASPGPAAKPAPPAPTPQPPPAAAAQAAEDAWSPAPPTGLLPAFFSEPVPGPRRVRAAAERSVVEPGSAVRVLATMIDPDGIRLTTDLTSFGSQSAYRMGEIVRNGSRYKLFTSVIQHGERLLVTAAPDERFASGLSGSVELGSGETGTIRLGDGQLVTVTPTIRPETPEEIEEGGHAKLRRLAVLRDPRPLRFQ